MRQDEFRREIIIDYICKLSGERVNPLPLFNEKEYCPICHRSLFPNDHHCICGQKIDWSDR